MRRRCGNCSSRAGLAGWTAASDRVKAASSGRGDLCESSGDNALLAAAAADRGVRQLDGAV